MWENLNIEIKFLDKEHIVSKLHLLEQLEKSDPYRLQAVSVVPLMDRIKNAVSYFEKQHQEGALALFANTIYLPSAFSHSVLWYLLDFIEGKLGVDDEEFSANALFLEVDPTGIVNEFIRSNNIPGRLDKRVFQRTQQVSEFVKQATAKARRKTIKEDVVPWLDRKYWIVLSDNSLSGTSLLSDLERLVKLAEESNKNPKIFLLIRTLTERASRRLDEYIETKKKQISIEYETGLFLDKRFVVTKENIEFCELFKDPDTTRRVVAACEWFVDREEYKADRMMEDHKKNSGDDLCFGFKECGLTIVASENCPSNSLPMLWYSGIKDYSPPFPRIISRLGENYYAKKD